MRKHHVNNTIYQELLLRTREWRHRNIPIRLRKRSNLRKFAKTDLLSPYLRTFTILSLGFTEHTWILRRSAFPTQPRCNLYKTHLKVLWVLTTSTTTCLAFMTQHLLLAPILDENLISYNTVAFDGRFENENVFRKSGGSEVDAEWKSLGVECEFNVFTNVSKPGVICRILTDLSGF